MRAHVLIALIALAASTAARADGLLLDVVSYLYRCRTGDLAGCVERDVTRTVDRLMTTNETYRLNRYLTVSVVAPDDGGQARGDDLPTRAADLFNALRVRYRPEAVADESESRKKKKKAGKHGKMGMLMASGAMLMSVVGGLLMKTKMHLALLIAVKALIMAKLALVLAGAVALRKLLGGGGGGGGGVQPVWNSGGGGGGEHGGYRRSYGFGDRTADRSASMAYSEQLPDSYDNHQT